MTPEVNLLPKLERRNSSNVYLLIIGAVLIFTAILFLVVQYVSLSSEVNELSSTEAQLITEKELLDANLLAISGEEKGSLETSVIFVEEVSYAVSPLLEEIDILLPENTYLKEYGFQAEEVKLIADFETMTKISEFVERLVISDYFTDVKIEQVENFELDSIGGNSDDDFTVIPRYSVQLTLLIDKMYLAAGGVRP